VRASTAAWAMLTILVVGFLVPTINVANATCLLTSSGTMLGNFAEGVSNSTVYPSTSPAIQDFLINNTATASTTQFAFYVSDSVALQNATFWNDDGTGGLGTNQTVNLLESGTGPAWTNFTVNPFSASTLLNFSFWVWNTNSSLPPATIGYRTLAIYNTTMPYTSLGKAITAVETANSWTTANLTTGASGVDPYQGLILNQNTTAQYESSIDSAATGYTTNDTANHVYFNDNFTWSGWSSPQYAWDNNTATWASYSVSPASYSSYIGFNLTRTINSTTIEYDVDTDGPTWVQMYVYISNDTVSWTNVFSGYPTYGAVRTNLTAFSRSLFSYVEYLFYNAAGGAPHVVNVYETRTWSDPYSHLIGQNYLAVLQYCSYIEKMNLTDSWSTTNKRTDIKYALGNITMVGNLPYTDTSFTGSLPDFFVSRGYALYGYYYANNSWASAYQSKWNITLAYNQFNASVYWTVANGSTYDGYNGMPLYIIANSTGETAYDRYYDEDAETIRDYLIFDYLLNQTDGLTQAAYWWNYVVMHHWNTIVHPSYTLQYFRYSEIFGGYQYHFECEAGFFLKITSIMKYYIPNIGNYSYVLTDIGTRFLSKEWNSYQWLDDGNGSNTTYSVVHLYMGNNERRLTNTLGAWQALLGAFLEFNSTYQSYMDDMLAGNTTKSIQPAWAELMNASWTNLWDPATKLFKVASDGSTTAQDTATGEITLFQLGILPGTSTVAFPLEELNYEYLNDIDPVLMAFNLYQSLKQITIPVVQAGTITFQYGESPITYNFTSSGVFLISFTNSCNMILSVTYQCALPSDLIYFYLPSPSHGMAGPSSALRVTTITAYVRSWPFFMLSTLVAVILDKKKYRPTCK
jgi:hypothetical protein